MSENKNEDTQPTQPVSPDLPHEIQNEIPDSPKKSKNWRWIGVGLLIIILVSAAGALGGYFAGIADRQALEINQRDLAASMQYQLGLADLEAGNLDLARQRFEYVIELNPAYPGVLESMAKLMIIMNATATPAVLPSATPAPTLDLSGVEAMLVQSKQLMYASDWNGALNALDNLRKQNVSFKTLEVDGLYYLALSHRGIQKISNGNLEGGIYDFAVMKNYGPQDKDSADMEEWAVMYLNASKYFGWDWENAVKYLGEIYQYIPTLTDSSHRSVADRYRESLGKYADTLAAKEKWCQSVPYYEQSLAIGNDSKVAAAYTKANNKCIALQPTEVPTIDPATIPTDLPAPTDVPAPTAEIPTEEPTPATP